MNGAVSVVSSWRRCAASAAGAVFTRAAHFLGLWKSERILVSRFLPDKRTPLLEAGCGAGRVSIALWKLGYRRLSAFDFASELLDQAQSLAEPGGGIDRLPVRGCHDDRTFPMGTRRR